MIANAQLDNERASNTYQIQLLKDKVEEMEETHAQLQREYKDKCRDYETQRRTNEKLMEDLKLVQGQLNERDTLIAGEGLTIVTIENDDGTDAKRALVTNENAQLLDTHQGSLGRHFTQFSFCVWQIFCEFQSRDLIDVHFLDVRLKKFTEEKAALRTEIDQLHQQLISAKTQRRSGSQNGPVDDDDFEDAQSEHLIYQKNIVITCVFYSIHDYVGEANKLIADYKYKLTKAEQEIASLQASLARSETQVIRYKSTADAAEKVEAELKVERRKLQREVNHFHFRM